MSTASCSPCNSFNPAARSFATVSNTVPSPTNDSRSLISLSAASISVSKVVARPSTASISLSRVVARPSTASISDCKVEIFDSFVVKREEFASIRFCISLSASVYAAMISTKVSKVSGAAFTIASTRPSTISRSV